MATPTEQKKQVLSSLGKSASLANVRTEGATPPLVNKNSPTQNTLTPQGIWISFFFDGTGNNLEADYGTREHSNVARLFRSHNDDPVQGIFRYYIPGIGTYFADINDPGNTALGGGAGDGGEERLKWAMQRMDKCLASSDGHKTVHVALFGFSRGATLARAFALLIAQRCKRVGDQSWRITLGQRTYPIRLRFMGLFDTVASVGVPMSANNAGSLVGGLGSTRLTLWNRSGDDLLNLAFGNEPGADPAPGFANGHMAWADDLRIPEMVEDCLHMMAAHEIRNSFPVDSVLQGLKYPSNCREMVYPGAHSDVGGGYRRGEGARSRTNGSLLSMIPLRAMRDEALKAGVPLRTDIPNNEDFAEDPASKDAFQLLCQRFTGYMNASGWGGKPVGTLVLSHMKRYYQWRFHRIARDQKDRKAGRPTKDEALLREFEGGWKAETARLAKETEARRVKFVEHAIQASRLKNSYGASHKLEAIRKEERFASIAKDEYLTLKARLDTLPGSDGSFLDYLKIYDAQLLEDARAIQGFAKYLGRQKLRPHYKAMLEAYEAEQRGQGLRDMGIVQFFDTYVHDSLAAFATDSTLPSDPRVIYIGGDDKLRYAVNQPLGQGFPTSALG
jgi:hypothetical protein